MSRSEEFYLSPRELEILNLKLSGKRRKAIEQELDIQDQTLRNTFQHIYQRIETHFGHRLNERGAIALLLQLEYLKLPEDE